jgi:hypothetical protein
MSSTYGYTNWENDFKESGGDLAGVLDTVAIVESADGKWVVFTAPMSTGTVLSSGANWIIDSGITLPSRSLNMVTVIKITGGTGAGQIRQISNNVTFNKSITSTNWDVMLDMTSTFGIYNIPTFEGLHPSAKQPMGIFTFTRFL